MKKALIFCSILFLSLSFYAQTGTICHYKIVEFKEFEIKKPNDEAHRNAIKRLNQAREETLKFDFINFELVTTRLAKLELLNFPFSKVTLLKLTSSRVEYANE